MKITILKRLLQFNKVCILYQNYAFALEIMRRYGIVCMYSTKKSKTEKIMKEFDSNKIGNTKPKEVENAFAEPKRNSSKKGIVIGAVIAAVGIIGGVGAIVLSHGFEAVAKQQNGAVIKIADNTVDTDSLQEEKAPTQPDYIIYPGYEDAEITKTTKWHFDNPQENGDFYFKIEVIDTDTNEVYFTSDLIPSGRSIEWVPGEVLDEGVYHLSVLQTPYLYGTDGEASQAVACGNNPITLTIN